MRKTGFLGLFFMMVIESVCWGDIEVQTLEPNRQDRFYTGSDKDFLGQSFDWSGVGQTGGGTWATMISPTYFLSAYHYHPGGGDTLTFYEGNVPSDTFKHQYTVASWGMPMSFDGKPSDLWLGRLTAPISTADRIAYYAVPDFGSDSDYIGQMIYVNGKPNRVGRNNIDRITTAPEPNSLGEIVKNTVAMEYDFNTTTGLGADECYLIGGDSGGPSFLDVNGQLALTGIHYYNGGTPGPEDLGPISGDSFVPYYIDQLDANMTGERVTTVVPEPNASILLLVGFISIYTSIAMKRILGKFFGIGLFTLVAVLELSVGATWADMYITGNVTPNPQRYYRFYEGTDKAFVGAGLDFSGVSIGGPWATMISPQYFITATHWPATSSSTLTFCEGNSLGTGTHTYGVDTSFQFHPIYSGQYADVCLGRLAQPIPATDKIAYYPVLTLPNNSDYVGMTIFNYGNPNLVGRNVISKIEPYAEGGENGPSMFYNYDVPGVGADETYLIGGDSGASSFAVVDGKLALLGEHFSTYGTSGLIPFDGGAPKASDGTWWSVDGFIPAYIAQLDAVLPAEQQITTVVPEPSTMLLLSAWAFAMLLGMRRRKQTA